MCSSIVPECSWAQLYTKRRLRGGERPSLSELKTSEREDTLVGDLGGHLKSQELERDKNLPPKGLGDLQRVLFPQASAVSICERLHPLSGFLESRVFDSHHLLSATLLWGRSVGNLDSARRLPRQ